LEKAENELDIVRAERDRLRMEVDKLSKRLEELEAKEEANRLQIEQLTKKVGEDREAYARLWCGAIVSQLLAHARAYIFTAQKAVDEGLHDAYPTWASLSREYKTFESDEQQRFSEVDSVMKSLNAALSRNYCNINSLQYAWRQSRLQVAHPSVFPKEDGTRRSPTDAELVDLITSNLAGVQPLANKPVLESNLKAVLLALHDIAGKNGRDQQPFDLF